MARSKLSCSAMDGRADAGCSGRWQRSNSENSAPITLAKHRRNLVLIDQSPRTVPRDCRQIDGVIAGRRLRTRKCVIGCH